MTSTISARTLQRCDFRSFLNIIAWYKVLKLSRQVEHIVPGNNIEEFPDKWLMTNQQRNILN